VGGGEQETRELEKKEKEKEVVNVLVTNGRMRRTFNGKRGARRIGWWTDKSKCSNVPKTNGAGEGNGGL